MKFKNRYKKILFWALINFSFGYSPGIIGQVFHKNYTYENNLQAHVVISVGDHNSIDTYELSVCTFKFNSDHYSVSYMLNLRNGNQELLNVQIPAFEEMRYFRLDLKVHEDHFPGLELKIIYYDPSESHSKNNTKFHNIDLTGVINNGKVLIQDNGEEIPGYLLDCQNIVNQNAKQGTDHDFN